MIFRGMGKAGTGQLVNIPSGRFAAIFIADGTNAATFTVTAEDGTLMISLVTKQPLYCMVPVSCGKSNNITIVFSGTGAGVQLFEAIP